MIVGQKPCAAPAGWSRAPSPSRATNRGGRDSERARQRRRQSADFFEASVRPVLAANCYDCHADGQMGGLRLDSREALLKGGRSGPALVPGDPDKSLLIQAVRHTSEKLKMPKGGRLKPGEIEALAEWVRAGRDLAHLRAATTRCRGTVGKPTDRVESRPTSSRPSSGRSGRFSRSSKAPVPAVSHATWPKTDIDRFVLARLEQEGLEAGSRRRQADADPARDARSHRAAADAGRDRRVRERRGAGRVCQGGGSPARVAALRRSVGPHLARRRALRRGRLPVARSQGPRPEPVSERLPVSRLGDQGVQRRHAVRPVRAGAARRRPAGRRSAARAHAAGAGLPRPRARGTTTTARSKSRAPTSATIASTSSPAASSG